MHTISWDDFSKVELRVGRVVAAEVFKEARKPAYVLQVDFGPELGVKKSSAQITHLYRPEDLVGKQVVAVVNFPPRCGRGASASTSNPCVSRAACTGTASRTCWRSRTSACW